MGCDAVQLVRHGAEVYEEFGASIFRVGYALQPNVLTTGIEPLPTRQTLILMKSET